MTWSFLRSNFCLDIVGSLAGVGPKNGFYDRLASPAGRTRTASRECEIQGRIDATAEAVDFRDAVWVCSITVNPSPGRAGPMGTGNLPPRTASHPFQGTSSVRWRFGPATSAGPSFSGRFGRDAIAVMASVPAARARPQGAPSIRPRRAVSRAVVFFRLVFQPRRGVYTEPPCNATTLRDYQR